jgi:hypothetical protein
MGSAELEDPYDYCPGGYHPVHLCDLFNGRYVVIHKLGHGSYSTVWLAQGIQQRRLVALKILTAVASEGDKGVSDARFLCRLGPEAQSPGSPLSTLQSGNGSSDRLPSFFPTLLDEFTVHGPNGVHCCVVTEVLGLSLSSLEDTPEFYKRPFRATRQIAVQLTQAVARIHECGIVHGGTCNPKFTYLPNVDANSFQICIPVTFCSTLLGWNPGPPPKFTPIWGSLRNLL